MIKDGHVLRLGWPANGPAGVLGPQERARAFRLTIALAVVFVLNAFDLAFTESQRTRGNFKELNFAAVAAVEHGPLGMAAYKALLLGTGVYILFRCRRHWQAEAGAWVLATCHVGLMAWWLVYLDAVELCLHNPFVDAPPLPY